MDEIWGLVWKVTQKHASRMPRVSSPSWRNDHIQFLTKATCRDPTIKDMPASKIMCTVLGGDSGDYGHYSRVHFLKDRQVDLIEHIDSNPALEDVLLDKFDFLCEVVIIRDVKSCTQPSYRSGRRCLE